MPASKMGLCGTVFLRGTFELKMLLGGGSHLSFIELEQLDDSELVALTLSGQKKSFEFIVRRYQKLVYNVIYQMVQNYETAADLTQDTFLKTYKNLGSFRHDSRLKPWILKIASNTALNYIRDSKGRYFDSLEELLEESPQSEPASSMCLEDQVELSFSQALLNSALQRLSPRHRHIFVLRYQHDMSYADISLVIDETESSVKSLLFRIREKLRKMLLEEQKVAD